MTDKLELKFSNFERDELLQRGWRKKTLSESSEHKPSLKCSPQSFFFSSPQQKKYNKNLN